MASKKIRATLPGLLWFGIKWHAYGSQPPHGLFREIYAPSCGFIQDMCVCAMRKVQWAHAGNMQAFVGIFLFFPGSPFDFFGILSVVELLCIPGEILWTTLAVWFDLTTKMTYYYFGGALLNYICTFMCVIITQGVKNFWKTLCLNGREIIMKMRKFFAWKSHLSWAENVMYLQYVSSSMFSALQPSSELHMQVWSSGFYDHCVEQCSLFMRCLMFCLFALNFDKSSCLNSSRLIYVNTWLSRNSIYTVKFIICLYWNHLIPFHTPHHLIMRLQHRLSLLRGQK